MRGVAARGGGGGRPPGSRETQRAGVLDDRRVVTVGLRAVAVAMRGAFVVQVVSAASRDGHDVVDDERARFVPCELVVDGLAADVAWSLGARDGLAISVALRSVASHRHRLATSVSRMGLFKSADEKWDDRARQAAQDGLSVWVVTTGDRNALRVGVTGRSLDEPSRIISMVEATGLWRLDQVTAFSGSGKVAAITEHQHELIAVFRRT